MTHLSLFNKFPRKFGLTGTVGGPAEIKYMERNFNVRVIKIPQFSQKRFAMFKGLIFRKDDEWEKAIVNAIKKETSRSKVEYSHLHVPSFFFLFF